MEPMHRPDLIRTARRAAASIRRIARRAPTPDVTDVAAEIEPTDDGLRLHRLRYSDPGSYVAQKYGESAVRRLSAVVDNGVPMDSLLIGGRWWQFENYLRQLLYIELRATRGPGWAAPLRALAQQRMQQAQQTSYMASPDDQLVLAYADVSDLLRVIERYWRQTSEGIGLPLNVWQGRLYELEQIRHRMAHCRRPHEDDLDRVEQTLRDLEPAANRALRAYTTSWPVNKNMDDPVVKDWCHNRHELSRLIEHGAKVKGIDFALHFGRQTWSDPNPNQVSGTPGFFWVMNVGLYQRQIYIDDFVAASAVRASMPYIGHIVQTSPNHLFVTFPAVGPPAGISDAIGRCFEVVFTASRPDDTRNHSVRHPWRRADLDPRVDAEGLLAVLSGLWPEDPITIFASSKRA
jgi:hypothetical protein